MVEGIAEKPALISELKTASVIEAFEKEELASLKKHYKSKKKRHSTI